MSTMTANPLWVNLQVELDRPDLLLQMLVLLEYIEHMYHTL